MDFRWKKDCKKSATISVKFRVEAEDLMRSAIALYREREGLSASKIVYRLRLFLHSKGANYRKSGMNELIKEVGQDAFADVLLRVSKMFPEANYKEIEKCLEKSHE